MATKEEIEIELLSSGYKIKWDNGDIGILHLNWGLHSGEWVNKESSGDSEFIFSFKWGLEFHDAESNENNHYFEEVELPFEKYSGRSSFQMLLVDALKKIFVRIGRKNNSFVVFLVKHFDVFFKRLEKKLDDTKLNINLITDIFEQRLLLSQSDLLEVKRSYTYPNGKEGKSEGE